jgi:hypothetical protein
MKTLRVLVAVLAAPALFAGETPHADKSQFHLFNPTPRALMRDLSTDRPDVTESAYTVDAGHFQVEMDLLRASYDRYNRERTDVRVESWSWANTNFKAGLLSNLDLQLVVPFHSEVRTDDRASRTVSRQRGFGDLTVRLKWNLWGNDGGQTALALMPFVKIPTAQDDLRNGAVEGGLIVPLSVELPAGWSMGVMAEFDFNEDGDGRGHHAEFVNSITFGHKIAGPLGGYVEFVSIATTDPEGTWNATCNCGLTYALTGDLQLDAGVNLGLTRDAEDASPFVGFSWRF